jgi:hypothetical protein
MAEAAGCGGLHAAFLFGGGGWAGLGAQIEASKEAGASMAEIREALAANGLPLSPRAFESALYRARRQARKKDSRKGMTPSASNPSPAGASPDPLKPTRPKSKRFDWDPLARPNFDFVDDNADEPAS